MRTKIKIIRSFEDNKKHYFPGEVYSAPMEFARRYVSRGDAEFVDGSVEEILPQNIKVDKVSIVILVKDALDYVKKCIESIVKYTDNYELIIVDNGSNEETKKYLNSIDYFDYTLITNEENMGVAYGWNQGIKIAKYDYVCFLNSDTVVTPDWLPKLMKGFNYSKEVGIVGPSTCHSATVQSMQTTRSKHTVTDQNSINLLAKGLEEDYVETAVIGFCYIISKKVFEKIGVFDYKRYGLATHEDCDFVWRASKAGFKSIWCVGSYVHHFGNKTTREMGIDPRELRLKVRPIWVERVNDKNLYIENDVKLGKVKKIKGTIPILMITWNRLSYTKQAIKAILDNTKNYKLFIWDNHSTDGTVEYLKDLKNENIEIYFSDKNTGLVPPMNYFLEKYPDYRYVAKVDNDTVVSKGWLKKLKEVMETYPFFAVEADHYLLLKLDIKENMDFYKNLHRIDFKGASLYLSDFVGGTGVIIRRKMVSSIPEAPGTLSGWVIYQHQNDFISAFYSGVWIDRLDQIGTNKYKEPPDFPEYSKLIEKMRPKSIIGSSKINPNAFEGVREKTKNFYETYKFAYYFRKSQIDVIMPVLDREEITIKTISSLLANNKNVRIIIIDNGSDNLDYLKAFKDLLVIKNKVNKGISHAFNQGLQFAKSKYIVLMHNDVVVNEKNWIEKAVNFMEENENVGIVGVAGFKGLTSFGGHTEKMVTAIDEIAIEKLNGFEEVAFSDGCLNIVRNIGLKFDEDYVYYYYDYDYSMQYRNNGYKIYVMGSSAVHFANERKLSTIQSKKYKEIVSREEARRMFVEKWKHLLPIET